jgi:hypothetical protein
MYVMFAGVTPTVIGRDVVLMQWIRLSRLLCTALFARFYYTPYRCVVPESPFNHLSVSLGLLRRDDVTPISSGSRTCLTRRSAFSHLRISLRP